MKRNVREARGSGNGDVRGAVATHCMDVLDAAYHTARGYDGGVVALAGRMQTRDKFGDLAPMNANTLQHKVNPRCYSHHVSLSEGRDMMVLSGNFSILYALAADTGHVALKADLDCSGMTMEKVGVMAKEFSDVVAAVTKVKAKTSARGELITPNEMASIEKEAVEMIAALNCLVGNMRAQMARAD